LKGELESGLITGPAGKRAGSQANNWERVQTPDGEMLQRTIVSRDGVARDLRTASEVEGVGHKKILAKAIGLPLSAYGVNGKDRSRIVESVVNAAMGIADNLPEVNNLDPKLREAAYHFADIVDSTRKGEAVEPEKWQKVQSSIIQSTIDTGIGVEPAEPARGVINPKRGAGIDI
jgi:Asp-tRNA(Asn)/Glu-tRNA(Gln) amidotransferase C subunit